jgi:hypothetical protein
MRKLDAESFCSDYTVGSMVEPVVERPKLRRSPRELWPNIEEWVFLRGARNLSRLESPESAVAAARTGAQLNDGGRVCHSGMTWITFNNRVYRMLLRA